MAEADKMKRQIHVNKYFTLETFLLQIGNHTAIEVLFVKNVKHSFLALNSSFCTNNLPEFHGYEPFGSTK